MIRSVANKSKVLKRLERKNEFIVKSRSRNYGNVTLTRTKNYISLSHPKEYKSLLNYNIHRWYNTSSLVFGNPWDGVSKEVFTMPALSPTMEDGTIISWLKKEGDSYVAGEALAEIETDKATVSLDATDDGILAKILIPEGTKKVVVGKPIAITVTSQEDVSKVKDYTPSSKTSSAPSTPTSTAKTTSKPSEPQKTVSTPRTGDRIFASPYAKLLSKEKGINLADIPRGTGPNSRIIAADVLEFIPSKKAEQVISKPQTPTKEAKTAPNYTDIDVTNIRRITAERLTFSKQSIPHYYLTMECNVDKLIKLREELNSLSNSEYKLSFNDFVIKAASKALKKVPEVNSEWRTDVIRRYHSVDINVAVNTDAGLFTPLIRNADKKGLSEIANEVKALAQKAKDSSLSLDDIQTGTFTISNLGMLGITEFSAVINPPQACILAVGSVNDKLSLKDSDNISIEKVMKVTLSCDHRVVDGAVGARWLQIFKDYLENPIKLIL